MAEYRNAHHLLVNVFHNEFEQLSVTRFIGYMKRLILRPHVNLALLQINMPEN
jgi:hypothetical protein